MENKILSITIPMEVRTLNSIVSQCEVALSMNYKEKYDFKLCGFEIHSQYYKYYRINMEFKAIRKSEKSKILLNYWQIYRFKKILEKIREYFDFKARPNDFNSLKEFKNFVLCSGFLWYENECLRRLNEIVEMGDNFNKDIEKYYKEYRENKYSESYIKELIEKAPSLDWYK